MLFLPRRFHTLSWLYERKKFDRVNPEEKMEKLGKSPPNRSSMFFYLVSKL